MSTTPEAAPIARQTMAIHTGMRKWTGVNCVAPPIILSTVFERPEVGDPPPDFSLYTRNGNPNREMLEETVAALEGGVDAMAFSSGVAAINAVLETVPHGGRIQIPRQLYMGTRIALQEIWKDRLRIDEVDFSDPDRARRALSGAKVNLIWLETPSNPLLRVTDLATVVAKAKVAGAIVAVDNTMATPILQRPFEFGADIVVHSTSKYIGGHSDMLGGIVVTREKGALADRLRAVQRYGGAVPSPFDCWLARRGIMTLPVRMYTHVENAFAMAEFLAAHPRIEKVYYPGLPDHPGHEVASAQMRGFGAVLSFQHKGGEKAAYEIPKRMKLAYNATSLGGAESLIEARKHAEGSASSIPDDLVRFSVGLEDPEDLKRDLEQAMAGL
jgi:cystathionine gamma-synthase